MVTVKREFGELVDLRRSGFGRFRSELVGMAVPPYQGTY